MWLENTHYHYDYVRLAWDTGFAFKQRNTPFSHQNKLNLVDIDKVIAERDVATVEHHIPAAVQYTLDNEQMHVLDINFVKVFRLNQLAVEYLLFCKKYLDNAVALLKEEIGSVKEENREVKAFNDELKGNAILLMDKIKEADITCSYKCDRCLKSFSTDEYLKGHQKRRHLLRTEPISFNHLNLEMEIKQKLNTTEMFIEKEDIQTDLTNNNDNQNKVNELQQKFESLKNHVECEFKLLQSQKEFEDKYLKWFQAALENINISQKVIRSDDVIEMNNDGKRKNSVTQTDSLKQETSEKYVQVEIVQTKEKNNKTNQETQANFENTNLPKIQDQISKMEDSVTFKVSDFSQKMENQIQMVWEKLNQLEKEKHIANDYSKHPELCKQTKEHHTRKSKPRSYFTKSRDDTDGFGIHLETTNQIFKSSENLSQLSDVQCKPKSKILLEKPFKKITVMQNTLMNSELQSSENDDIRRTSQLSEGVRSKIILSDFANNAIHKSETNTSTLGKRSLTSLKNTATKTQVLNKFKEEMGYIIQNRIKELGISPDWTGIPDVTFQRATEIINHQAMLTANNFRRFKKIKQKILKTVDKAVRNKDLLNNFDQNGEKCYSKKKQNNLIGAPLLRKATPRVFSNVEIKNRDLFYTDSDSDVNENLKPEKLNNKTKGTPYSNVIQELKNAQTSKFKEVDDHLSGVLLKTNEKIFKKNQTQVITQNQKSIFSEDGMEKSPLTFFSEENKISKHYEKYELKPDFETKSVLKNFTSGSTVPKKKVIFDLKSTDSNKFRTLLPPKDGGSTTSVASSVFDGSQNLNYDTDSNINFDKN